MPETYRSAVLLADVLEYSYKEMSVLMDCPMGTVMSRLYRGRQKLQARLQPYAVSQGYIRTAWHPTERHAQRPMPETDLAVAGMLLPDSGECAP